MKHSKNHEALQQQHTLLQSTCQQLQQDLQNTQTDLSVSREQAELLPPSQSAPLQLSPTFRMQANSTILDSCNADELGMEQTGTRLAAIQSCEVQPAKSSMSGEVSKNGDAVVDLQQLAEQIADLSWQQGAWPQCTLVGLHAVEMSLERALSMIQGMSRTKSCAEVSKLTASVNQLEQLVEQYKVCPLCMEHDLEFVLSCGHQLCSSCSTPIVSCPFCRTPVSRRTRVFRA